MAHKKVSPAVQSGKGIGKMVIFELPSKRLRKNIEMILLLSLLEVKMSVNGIFLISKCCVLCLLEVAVYSFYCILSKTLVERQL